MNTFNTNKRQRLCDDNSGADEQGQAAPGKLIDRLDEWGKNKLHRACCLEDVKLLADVNIMSDEGYDEVYDARRRPLFYAICDVAIVQFLLENGADPNRTSGRRC